MVDPKKLREDYDFDDVVFSVGKGKFFCVKGHKRIREAKHHEIYDCWSFDESQSYFKQKKELKQEIITMLNKYVESW